MRKLFFASDLVIFAYMGAVTVLLLARWPHVDRPGIYLAYHAAVAAMIAMILYADAKHPKPFWRFVRHWFCVAVVLASFREIHFLVPDIHPFDSMTWDARLDRIDRLLFGDVGSWLRFIAWRPLVDLLSLCYWTYFPLPLILGALLWKRGETAKFREFMTVVLFAMFVSYLGYFSIPAVGPYLYEAQVLGIPRDPVLDGLGFSRILHDLLVELEWRTPDAFPSGHALIAMVCVVGAFRYRAGRFWTAFCGTGIVLATVYLRYHYVTDVLVSVLLLPLCWWLGLRLFRWWERESQAPPPAVSPSPEIRSANSPR